MIGMSLHSRIERQTSTPFPSGRIRSRIAASGGRTDTASSASCAVSAVVTSKPASRSSTRSARRIWRSSSQTSTRTALTPPASSPARGGGRSISRDGQLDHEARALAGQRLGPDAAAVGLQEAARDRKPEARARCRPVRASGRTARRCARALRSERPARGRSTRRIATRPARAAAHHDRIGPGEMARVLEHVRERTLELCGVRLNEWQVRIKLDVEAGGRRGRPTRSRRGPPRRASTSRCRGSALPACKAREVEQVVHEPRESRALVGDHRGELARAARRRDWERPGRRRLR